MRYWWVNQNQTFLAERKGGYLWSPKRKSNGDRNHFYETMREVAPGDLVFSFRNGGIAAVSTATSYSYEAIKPAEFGAAGPQWENVGWKIDATYSDMLNPVRPAEHMAAIGPSLPAKYAPLQANGHGLQAVYLAEIGEPMARVLLSLLQAAGNRLPTPNKASPHPTSSGDESVAQIEARAVKLLDAAPELTATEREALVKARLGQGIFRERVQKVETHCRITGVADPAFLIASHIKPWRSSSNQERLDAENGLLLTPTFDRLFDRGFIGFNDSGDLLVSPVLDGGIAKRLGVPAAQPTNCGTFTTGQRHFLEYHRSFIFKRAQ